MFCWNDCSSKTNDVSNVMSIILVLVFIFLGSKHFINNAFYLSILENHSMLRDA